VNAGTRLSDVYALAEQSGCRVIALAGRRVDDAVPDERIRLLAGDVTPEVLVGATRHLPHVHYVLIEMPFFDARESILIGLGFSIDVIDNQFRIAINTALEPAL
jgi:hypothetical protein